MTKKILLILNMMIISTSLFSQNYQTVRGSVCEKITEGPIPYASVMLQCQNSKIVATADSAGLFSIKHVPIGRYDIKVSSTGYEPIILKEIVVSSSKESVLSIMLNEHAKQLDEITVKPNANKAEAMNPMSLAGGRMLSVEEARRYAGGMDDPARLASSFAGVTSSIGNNGIVIRGNAPTYLQWRMEDVEIPNPNHFADVTSFGGGGFTSLSSQVLGNSDFYTGTFPSEYGNAISGVFDMKLRNGNNVKHENTFQIGTIGIDMASEGPIKKNYNGSYIFNYRYSTLSLISPLLPDDASGTKYQDLSFKFFLPSSKFGVFTLWGTGLIDRSGTKPEKDKDKWEYEQDKQNQDVKQYMAACGLGHKIYINESTFVKSTLAATVSGLNMHTELMNQDNILCPKNIIKNTNWNFIIASSINKKFNDVHTNKTGIQWTGLRYDMLMKDSNHNGDDFKTINNCSGSSSLLSAYSSSLFQLSENVDMTVGVNAQFFTLNSHYTIEPRFALKWKFLKSQSLSLGYGMHSRLEKLNYYFVKSENGSLINKDLDFTKSHNLSIAYDVVFGYDYHLKVEPYIQYLYSVPVIPDSTYSFVNLQGNDDWFISNALENKGKALNYGIDFTFEHYMRKGFYYMFTSSIFNSRYKTTKDEWYNTRYNRNYVFNIIAGKEWYLGKNKQNVFSINGKITYQGGDRYSPINISLSKKQQDAVYNESNPYSCRLSPMLLSHLTISYKINKKSISHEFSAKLMNITGYKDYYGHRYNFKNNSVEEERDAIIMPNISYKIEF